MRYRRKYYATNRLSLSAKEVRTLYRKRQEVEEVIRVLKSQLSLEACQAGYRRSAEQSRPGHRTAPKSIILRCVWWRTSLWSVSDSTTGDTWRQRKRHLILKGQQVPLPALERVRKAA